MDGYRLADASLRIRGAMTDVALAKPCIPHGPRPAVRGGRATVIGTTPATAMPAAVTHDGVRSHRPALSTDAAADGHRRGAEPPAPPVVAACALLDFFEAHA